jgi:type II secretory pathway predicted ATPase ExeA
MDYVKFFGLECEPFQNDLDDRFYFEGSSQRRARMHLLRAVQQRKGLALLLGGPGLGKTTLAHHLLRELDPGKFAAHLLLSSHRDCARGWLLPQLARAHGVAKPSARVPELIEQIQQQLLGARRSGRHPVLFVDEAQLLGEAQTLEEFRALLNFSHEGQRIFSLVLFGMEELGGILALDPSLAQRIDVRVQLCAFSAAETAAYLAHRLERAGAPAGLLAPAAVDALHRYSGGVLRVLNTLADNALFEAALEESRRVGVEHVASAAQQLELRPHAPPVQVSSPESATPAPAQTAAPEPESLPAGDEPLLGDSSADVSAATAQTDDWLEPVTPVLDEVMKSFDPEAHGAEPAPARARGSDRDDPLEWSLLDLAADPTESEAPDAPRSEELEALPGGENADDSMANLSFGDQLAAPETEPEAIELEDAVDELMLDEEPGTAAHVGPATRGKGPKIDLPEDDDLDSLFDDIQIES